MIKKNILITGSKNTGKSTLVQKILQQFSTSYAGFQTIPFEIFEAGPTYLMRDLITKKQMPISKCVGKRIVGIPITFSTFGKIIVSLLDAQAANESAIMNDKVKVSIFLIFFIFLLSL